MSFYSWGPSHTPPVIRRLILFTICIALFSALTEGLFTQLLGLPGPQELLSLSLRGVKNYFLWQPLSYLFVQDGGIFGINLFFLLTLAINTYFIWILGSSVHERMGSKHFLGLYFSAGIAAGLVAVCTMALLGHNQFIAGPTAALMGLFVIWTMLFPESELILFFILPMKTRWILGGILGAALLISLSQLDIVSFMYYLTGAIVGYLYGVLAFGLRGPFAFTRPLDRLLKKKGPPTKIVDMTGDPVLDDDAFVDEMLTKISKHGETSLSNTERRRLDRISKAKIRSKQG